MEGCHSYAQQKERDFPRRQFDLGIVAGIPTVLHIRMYISFMVIYLRMSRGDSFVNSEMLVRNYPCAHLVGGKY